ncbi:hypothetical protein J18TS1_21110 [Oceanobacillus oncorhynchi subsp. incaldanensis]|uniref:DUF1146 domain-containing protein n=2 Tax=Oceanobacillus TaxID=182709 RepID=A0A0A1M675_9BACI|nr:DUF1146 family protein [Oceanobacillus oncorhynchi]GIO19011.1 hypothetical protein J18TS1_21110 [Oceanobacillus oncorhynchi subsp. incaldanensis]CEI80780.1 hypothetical protein BN997_00589 [Oceanobacillus oncorhynchi]
MFSAGQLALLSIFSHIMFIYLTWKVVTAIRIETIFKKGRSAEARVFLLFITIMIGTGVSRFFLDILQWSGDLIYLFSSIHVLI